MQRSKDVARLAINSWRGSAILQQGWISVGITNAEQGAVAQLRFIGGKPEHFGKPSQYTEGTKFLGTPADHLERVEGRPMAPDVFDVDGSVHYKFPVAPISSITNRVSGVALSGQALLLSSVAYFGDVGLFLNSIKAFTPFLVTAKFIIAFTLSYHLLAGLRHFYWDYVPHSNLAEKDSSIDLQNVDKSSYQLLYGSLGLSVLLALYSSK